MKAYLDQIMRMANEQGALLAAAESLRGGRIVGGRALRLCLSALLLVLLTAIPAQCGAVRF